MTAATRRPSVLVIAEAANPEWVSVPLVGWSMTQALRSVADVHLVTQSRNRAAILRAGGTEDDDFTAIDSDLVAGPLFRLGRWQRRSEPQRSLSVGTALHAIGYPYFERLVWRRFGRAIRAGRFDLVHRVTPLTPTAVSPLAALCARAGVPFVLGPLNGGVPWPPGYESVRDAEGEWLSRFRAVHRLMPGRGEMMRAATIILAGSRHTQAELQAQMPRDARDRVLYLPENAVDPALFVPRRTATDITEGGPLRGCFVGRLVPYKGALLAVEALAPLLRDGRMRFDVVGDGPEHGALEAFVAREALGDAVTIHGILPHPAVPDVLGLADVLVSPAVREFGGAVALEAMALGVVPVVADYAGPSELIDDATGFRVPLGGGRDDLRAALTRRLVMLANDRSTLPAMAEAGMRRASAFTWDAKARQVGRAYDWALGRADRPDALI